MYKNITAISGGIVTIEGGNSITSRGVCWSNLISAPRITNSRTLDVLESEHFQVR